MVANQACIEAEARAMVKVFANQELIPDSTTPDLQSWIDSDEGKTARALMKAQNVEIWIAEDEGWSNVTSALMIRPKGIYLRSRLIKMSPDSKFGNSSYTAISADEAVKMGIRLIERVSCSKTLVMFIRKKVTELAERINPQAL